MFKIVVLIFALSGLHVSVSQDRWDDKAECVQKIPGAMQELNAHFLKTEGSDPRLMAACLSYAEYQELVKKLEALKAQEGKQDI